MMIDFRVNTLPGINGEKMVLRIIGQAELRSNVSEIGFRSDNLRIVNEALKSPYGMILVTGPTGSGKTTTLYTILQQLNTQEVNILTAEDPVEYHLNGITQINVRPAIGFNFGMALRAFLRQDPDIIFIGEMRDYETGAIAVRAALTGHLLLSTIHTNNCASTVSRLVEMGIEPYLIASALRLVISQRLVRRICENCKEELPLREAERLDLDESTLADIEHLYRGKGCDQCNGIGYFGRAPVFEVMPIRTDEMRGVVTEAGTEDQVMRVARSEGFKLLKEEAIAMVNEGVTTLDEALKIIIME
jgi:type IV pilus assembly protein PilB